MTRNDIKALFPDAEKAQIDQLLDINSSDIGKAMNKSQTAQDQLEGRIKTLGDEINSLNDRIKALTDDVAKKDATIKGLTDNVAEKDKAIKSLTSENEKAAKQFDGDKEAALNELKAQHEIDLKALMDKHTDEMKALNDQLKTAQDRATVADTLTERVSQLTKDIADRDATIASNNKQYLVKDALRGMHAKNVDVLLPLLNLDKITVGDNNQLEGFVEQLKPIQERDAYLFDTNTGSQRAGVSAIPDVSDNTSPATAVNQAIRQLAGIR